MHNICHGQPATVIIENSRVIPGATLYRCEVCLQSWYAHHPSQGWVSMDDIARIRLEESVGADVEYGGSDVYENGK